MICHSKPKRTEAICMSSQGSIAAVAISISSAPSMGLLVGAFAPHRNDSNQFVISFTLLLRSSITAQFFT